MELARVLSLSPDLKAPGVAAAFERLWTTRHLPKGALLHEQGAADGREVMVLDGRLTSHIYGPEGEAACVGLYAGPCIVVPHIARSREGRSLVTSEAVTDVLIAEIGAKALEAEMLANPAVRDWANGILREALADKADREWALAALGGAERLAWFRARLPEYEAHFVHGTIASYLGMSPVTFSRLRRASS